MKKILLFVLLLSFWISGSAQNDTLPMNDNYSIVIHGGAGTITKSTISEEKAEEIRIRLQAAITIGQHMLKGGKSAIEVVEAVIRYMEDCPEFNAGKGAVFNSEGKQEMDACIMNGKDLSTGAVAGVQHLKNPITGARLVKDSTRHVLLSGQRAEKFCLGMGAEYADSSYFYTKRRYDYWKKIDNQRKGLNDGGAVNVEDPEHKYGTVGCVVLDRYGNLAAATSTGGLTYKEHGRIGDSPIVGAGTYANNESCAVSCTGTGEFFIRGTIARDIAALMEFKGVSLQKAGEITLKKLNEMKGDGGFIAVDKKGNTLMLFNTEGMYRASLKSGDDEPAVLLYGD